MNITLNGTPVGSHARTRLPDGESMIELTGLSADWPDGVDMFVELKVADNPQVLKILSPDCTPKFEHAGHVHDVSSLLDDKTVRIRLTCSATPPEAG